MPRISERRRVARGLGAFEAATLRKVGGERHFWTYTDDKGSFVLRYDRTDIARKYVDGSIQIDIPPYSMNSTVKGTVRAVFPEVRFIAGSTSKFTVEGSDDIGIINNGSRAGGTCRCRGKWGKLGEEDHPMPTMDEMRALNINLDELRRAPRVSPTPVPRTDSNLSASLNDFSRRVAETASPLIDPWTPYPFDEEEHDEGAEEPETVRIINDFVGFFNEETVDQTETNI